MTLNVKTYVDTVKGETEALGTIAQEELDQAVDTICRNLPFLAGSNSENTTDDESSTREKRNHGGKVVENADLSQGMEGESRKGTEQEREKLKMEMQWEKDNKLHHDPLFPPGRIIYLNRVITPGSLSKSVTTDSSVKNDVEAVEVVEVATDDFSRVVLSNRMLLDHLCTDYEKVLQCQAELLKSSPDST